MNGWCWLDRMGRHKPRVYCGVGRVDPAQELPRGLQPPVCYEGSKMPEKKKAEKKRWVSGVKTVSTYPPAGTFNKDAETIARTMASKKVSPKGVGSGIRMIQYFINRAGKNLPC